MIKTKLPFILLILLVLLQIGLTSGFILTHYYELKNSAFDGKTFEQLLFNILNGDGMTTTIPPPYVSQSWFGFHFSPIIYLVVPFYYFFPHIETLLLIQSTLIALAGLPIFFIAKKLLHSQWQALIIAFIYLINPFVFNAQLWDFHEIAFAPLTFSMLLWAIITRNKLLTILCCLFLITIKEHYGLAVFGTGLLWAWYYREPKFGLLTALFGLSIFFIVIFLVMPFYNPDGAAAMLNQKSEIGNFSWIFFPINNLDFLVKIFAKAILYGALLLIPFLFLPVINFAWLFPAIADLLVNSVSVTDMARHPVSYHSAAIIPVLLVAYCKTVKDKFSSTSYFSRNSILCGTVLLSALFFYNLASLPHLPKNLWEFSTLKTNFSAHDETTRNEIIAIIGKDSVISAQVNILSYVPVRRDMFVFPYGLETAEYILLHTSTPFKKRPHVFSLPFSDDGFEAYFNDSKNILTNQNFGIVYYKNNWLLLKRSAVSEQHIVEQAVSDIETTKTRMLELKKMLSWL